MENHILTPIAHMHSDFPEKFGIPRQSGIVPQLESLVVFEPEYRSSEALRGIEEFSHLWLIWQFSEARKDKFSPTVRPPRLGGNIRMGVFATRSPFRPNSLGLSCVELARVEKRENLGMVLVVRGADLMDGTPIYDVKPYIPYADCHVEAKAGFAPDSGSVMKVEIPEELLGRIPAEKREALKGILENDPRPRYQHDPSRVYSMRFAGMDVRFTVENETVKIEDIDKTDSRCQ